MIWYFALYAVAWGLLVGTSGCFILNKYFDRRTSKRDGATFTILGFMGLVISGLLLHPTYNVLNGLVDGFSFMVPYGLSRAVGTRFVQGIMNVYNRYY